MVNFQLEQLEEETVVWCREILRNSPMAIRLCKSSLNAVEDGHAGLQVIFPRGYSLAEYKPPDITGYFQGGYDVTCIFTGFFAYRKDILGINI